MLQLLAIGLGGFAGALARYGLSLGVDRLVGVRFPLGTLMVNVLGCLAIGMLAGLVERRVELSTELRALLAVGFLGSFTTFSTFALQTVDLGRAGQVGAALLNTLLQVTLSIGAVLLGRGLGLRTLA